MDKNYNLYTGRNVYLEPEEEWTGIISGETQNVMVGFSFPNGVGIGNVFFTLEDNTTVFTAINDNTLDSLEWYEWEMGTVSETTISQDSLSNIPPSALRFVNLSTTDPILFYYRGIR